MLWQGRESGRKERLTEKDAYGNKANAYREKAWENETDRQTE